MDQEKQKVATSIMEKNKKVEAFMIVQKEKEEVQKKKQNTNIMIHFLKDLMN